MIEINEDKDSERINAKKYSPYNDIEEELNALNRELDMDLDN